MLAGRLRSRSAPKLSALWVVAGAPALVCWSAVRGQSGGGEGGCRPPSAGGACKVRAVDPPVAGFFGKRLLLRDGVGIAAHRDVSDGALLGAGSQIGPMLAGLPRAAVDNMRDAGAQLRVLGKDQQTSDMPDLRHWRGKVWEKSSGKTIDERARGLGGISCLCAEENILALPSDRHKDHRCICVHEFAHVIHRVGVDERMKRCITAAYARAKAAGLWPGCYAISNEQEFFAELSMWYFGSHGDYGKIKPRPVPGRDWLAEYDPGSYRMLRRLYSGERAVARRQHCTLQPVWPPPSTPQAIAALHPRGGGEVCALTFDNRTAHNFRLWWVPTHLYLGTCTQLHYDRPSTMLQRRPRHAGS